MSSIQGKIKRYSLILEKVKYAKYPSKKDIDDHLIEHGFEIGDRTLSRDIAAIREEFGVGLEFSTNMGGYYIDENKSFKAEAFDSYLNLLNAANILQDCLNHNAESLQYIAFESSGEFKGLEHLQNLLFAIQNLRVIQFDHENYTKGTVKRYEVNPYFLKEYQNRWYLIAEVETEEGNYLFTFGIDRMKKLTITQKNFALNKNLNAQDMFHSVIGLNQGNGKPQKVLLEFTPLQGKYVKSLPLHHSQKIVEDSNEKLIIELYVVINLELIQKILSMGNTVKVLEPESLKIEVLEMLKQAVETNIK